MAMVGMIGRSVEARKLLGDAGGLMPTGLMGDIGQSLVIA